MPLRIEMLPLKRVIGFEQERRVAQLLEVSEAGDLSLHVETGIGGATGRDGVAAGCETEPPLMMGVWSLLLQLALMLPFTVSVPVPVSSVLDWASADTLIRLKLPIVSLLPPIDRVAPSVMVTAA